MIIATHIKSGKAYEGHKQGLFFVSGEIGSNEPHVPRDCGGFFEWRSWTQEDHDFNLPKLTFNEIDTSTMHGQMLLAAIAKITTESQTDKTPDEVMKQLNELRIKMDFDEIYHPPVCLDNKITFASPQYDGKKLNLTHLDEEGKGFSPRRADPDTRLYIGEIHDFTNEEKAEIIRKWKVTGPPKQDNADIILTKDDNEVITIHFKDEVSFLAGWEYAGELCNHKVDIVAFSDEFNKGSKTVDR